MHGVGSALRVALWSLPSAKTQETESPSTSWSICLVLPSAIATVASAGKHPFAFWHCGPLYPWKEIVKSNWGCASAFTVSDGPLAHAPPA